MVLVLIEVCERWYKARRRLILVTLKFVTELWR